MFQPFLSISSKFCDVGTMVGGEIDHLVTQNPSDLSPIPNIDYESSNYQNNVSISKKIPYPVHQEIIPDTALSALLKSFEFPESQITSNSKTKKKTSGKDSDVFPTQERPEYAKSEQTPDDPDEDRITREVVLEYKKLCLLKVNKEKEVCNLLATLIC